MAGSLDQLVQEALGGIINSGGLPTADALYNQLQQGTQENTFGRGLGISTVTRDALAKARVDATLQAQQAQLSALGQAASVAQHELDRGQAGSQFAQNLALQKKQLGQQSDIANRQLMAQGIGLGASGLMNVAGRAFKPEIMGGLGRLAGVGGAISPMGGRETMLPQQMVPGMPNAAEGFSAGEIPGGGSIPSYSMPDLSGIGGAISSPDILGSMSGLGDLGLWDFGGLSDLAGYGNVSDVIDPNLLWAP